MTGITCFICSDAIGDDQDRGVIKEKALQSFIEASKRRKDGHHRFLETQTTVVVHEKCRKGVYTRESSIVKAEKESQNTSRVTRGTAEAFNFKDLCIYCVKDASVSYEAQQVKLAKKRRNNVMQIMSLETIKSIKEAANARGDAWGQNVLGRLSNVCDLVAAEGRYHKSCRRAFFLQAGSSTTFSRGRPESADLNHCVDFVCNYVMENEDLCQFSIEEILKLYPGPVHDKRYIVEKLTERFQSEILIVPGKNQFVPKTICYQNTGHKILTKSWYEERKCNMQDERMRIVKAAGEIIREDIRTKVYILDKYPSPDLFLDDVHENIPDSLKMLLDTITMRETKTDTDNVESSRKKTQAIAHSIISATRPRSFTSPILLGVGTLLYRKYGSRHLIDVLSAIGFSSSYAEVRKFEISTLQQPLKVTTDNTFTQFVFDNADINMDTLDGHDTFHAMGGIQCFTPKKSLIPRVPINKVKVIPNASSLKEYGSIPLEIFDKPCEGFSRLSVKPIPTTPEGEVLPRPMDLLWMYGKWKKLNTLPGWNGFMETVTSKRPFQVSQILCLPFIRAPPSNNDTIYTALKTAAQKCVDQNQTTCFVTFDQPLYIKARQIVASSDPGSEINSITVRLGGFHLVMSFMGAIGFIMDGSGLQDLFNVSFALASTKTMMSGHYYSRAVRGHILVHLALGKRILSTMTNNQNDPENDSLLCIIEKFESDDGIDIHHPKVNDMLQNFKEHLKTLEQNGPTAKLWVQYFRMVSILKQFIEAERSGNWELHLESIKNMLPYFHASGHFNYSKAAQMYLQDMQDLERNLTPAEYHQFVNEGAFTIRRTLKHWSGIWTDMTIEQVLMRAISSCGGLSRGRGISDGTLARWIAGMPTAVDVTHQVEEFCGVSFSTSDQHIDTTNSRMERDNSDVEKFENWFDSHDPFPHGETIMCISTGVLGDDDTNCHQAYDIGQISMENIQGKKFKELKFQRKNRVKPLQAVKCGVKINNEPIPVSPETIFRRIPFHLKSPDQLKSYFSFELAPYPLSLFDDVGMRKTKKSDLYKLFNPVLDVEHTDNAQFVIDGGFLLHRVVWNSNESFSSILMKYVNYVKKHFKLNSTIVFDGYPENASEKSVKSAERARRARVMSSAVVLFDETMNVTMPKERFLSNESNKKRLITMLKPVLTNAEFQVRQASEDADTLIVSTAIELAEEGGNVFIVGEDIDLLVLLTAHVTNNDEEGERIRNIFIMKPGKGREANLIYSPESSRLSQESKKHLLFLHAFSGCDSTSAFFRQGKSKFVSTFEKQIILQSTVNLFMDPNATADQITEAGAKFIVAMYSGGSKKSLSELRLHLFQKALSKCNFNLACLPPTDAAAQQHSFRTFFQVQFWIGNVLDPEKWGWKKTKNGLSPIATNQPPAPEELLNCISCSCLKGCQASCSCRRAGVKCSAICLHCKGHSCRNSLVEELLLDDTFIDDPADTRTGYSDNSSSEDEAIETDIGPAGPSSPKRRRK